jgi:hypothetical protein
MSRGSLSLLVLMFVKYFFLAVVIFLNLTSAGSSSVEKFEKITELLEVDFGVNLPITIYVPRNIEKPLGLVIVSPGSEGEGFLYLEAELKKNKFDPDHRGGLVSLLSNSGYAIVFASQRGRLDVGSCVSGANFEQRLKSYAVKCTVKDIRKDVDLHMVTSDIGKIYSHLEKHRLFRDVPLISLSYSEASYHISKLISDEKIQPIGVVFIGGMYKKSWAKTMESQLKRDFYFQKIEETFKLTAKETISFADVVEYGKLNFVLGFPNRPPWGLGITMGDVYITKAEAARRKAVFASLYQGSIEFFKGENLPTFIDASVHEHQLLEYFTSAYVSQSYRAGINNIELLKSYKGKVNFIFGDADSLVDVPSPEDCALSAFRCTIEIVNGVGHSLEDESGFPTAESLRAVLKAINNVALKK